MTTPTTTETPGPASPSRPVTPVRRHLPAQTRERLERQYGRIGLPALAAALETMRAQPGPSRTA